MRSPRRRYRWFLFGAFCAVGVALRSTLILMGLVAILLPLVSSRDGLERRNRRFGNAALVTGGMMLALLPWSFRNHAAFGGVSALPLNAGIVLHQVYNADNPTSSMWVPEFVNYAQASEIWRGYAAEASRRLGRPLSPLEVDRYWRAEALSFMRAHPGQVLRDILHKSLLWLSSTEIPSSRADVEERMFSPVLRFLPSPAIWLLALGFGGLAWLALEDRRWMVIATPIAVAWLAFVVFFAESRFRVHAASMLALCSGIWIDQLVREFRHPLQWSTAVHVGLAAGIAITAAALAGMNPPLPVHWDRIAWGYIKMGNLPEAANAAERGAREQPANGAIIEVLGYTAAAQQRYGEAKSDFERAIELRPRSHLAHYNLARVYLALGNRTAATAEAKIAAQLNPSPDYDALVAQLTAAN
jgi:tetratricopeptide (TPR) repeat protein